MKKFIYCLALYIGLILAFFKPVTAAAEDLEAFRQDELMELIKNEANKKKSVPLIQASNEFIKVAAVIYLVDKLYPDGKINDDITGFLQRVWPDTKIEKLRKVAPFIQSFVMYKRRYGYVIDRLKQRIKAGELLPEDAPIVAKDGEFAPKHSDARKQTTGREYKVSYEPYKYLGYDGGEYGDPVRRRDKNYEEVNKNALDELTLALLEFDIGGFYRALRKMPSVNDGTREKPVELGDGIRSRLLLATSHPGDMETIKGVMEIFMPKGWYLNGDYLNEAVKPKFFLSEDVREDLNIKAYRLYQPIAYGVVSGGKTRRVLIDSIRFPVEFDRRDVNKDMHIKGKFVFEACKGGSNECHTVVSENSLTLEASDETMPSFHSNFVEQAFWNQPKEKSKHASLERAVFDKDANKLYLEFKTDKTFSNVGTMAEDAYGSDFVAPEYDIEEGRVAVSFDAKLEKAPFEEGVGEGREIAVSAAFDDKEILRITVVPEISHGKPISELPEKPDYMLAFMVGMLINLAPMMFYLLQRLLQAMFEQKKRLLVLLWYTGGIFVGIGVWFVGQISAPWYAVYTNPIFIMTAFLIVVSALTGLFGYMNFNFFQPFREYIGRGFFIGLMSVLFVAVLPFLYKSALMNNIAAQSMGGRWCLLMTLGAGMLILPVMMVAAFRYLGEFSFKMHGINRFYTLFAVLILLWLGYSLFGIGFVLLMVISGMITAFVWYVYPMLLHEGLKHVRKKADQRYVIGRGQRLGLTVITAVFLLGGGISLLFRPVAVNVPSISEIQETAQKQIAKKEILLFTLNSDWSVESVLNKRIIMKLSDAGMKVVEAKMSGDNNTATREWLHTYGRKSPPLNVLFTARHPQGLVLPADLRKVRFGTAAADFFE